MEKKKAEQILSENVLTLDTAGLENLPVKTVEVDRYFLREKDGRADVVYLYGNMQDKENSKLKFVEADYHCESFFVQHEQKYWYRDYLEEALDVKDALMCLFGAEE